MKKKNQSQKKADIENLIKCAYQTLHTIKTVEDTFENIQDFYLTELLNMFKSTGDLTGALRRIKEKTVSEGYCDKSTMLSEYEKGGIDE